MSANTVAADFPHVAGTLDTWAKWRTGGAAPLGIKSPFARYQKRELDAQVVQPADQGFDTWMLAVDAGVCQLDPTLRAVVEAQHCMAGAYYAWRERLKHAACAQATYYRRLGRAYQALDVALFQRRATVRNVSWREAMGDDPASMAR